MKIKNLLLPLLLLLNSALFAQLEYEEVEEAYIEDEYFEGHNPNLYFDSEQEYHNWNFEYDDSYTDRYDSEAFKYEEPEEKEQEVPQLENKIEVGFNAVGLIMKILLIAAIILVLYLVVKALMDFRINRNKKIADGPVYTTQEQDMDDLEDLETSDLHALIDRAKSNNDYALAVRYYFLLYLQGLQELNFITYHRDKTNYDYLLEIDDEARNLQFIKVSQVFEYIWYGKKPIDESSFLGIELLFKEQISKVK
ncbi:hypothetical protein GYB22_12835 [bacterium]|nr:hypothetical protein [bacterium]